VTVQIRNPHSVLAALEKRAGDVQQIVLPPGKAGADWDQVAQLAKKRNIRLGAGAAGPKGNRDPRGVNADAGRISAAHAVVREKEGISVEELFAGAQSRAGGRGLWLALDSLQDPHNVGAIFRTAAFFGVQGILMTQDRSAPLTGAVYDVASGGVEHVPFTSQVNLQRAFEVAKDAGLWILGSSEHAKDDLSTIERDRPWLLVLGNEESGMRRLTEESCDVLCKVTARGSVTSLNVSVAAGVLISHLSRG
jgi:23S rRNA (guanosine2251-2'-O)-methyltransferase